MLAVKGFRPQKEANILVNTPTDPAQALIRRFTAWEKRIENLIEFFTQIQKFQKEHSRHYSALAEVTSQRVYEDEGFIDDPRGVLGIWNILRDKTLTLARFYDGLNDSYNDTVVKDLRSQLVDIRVFRTEIQHLRTREGSKVAKKQKRFFDSVSDLKLSINRFRKPTPSDDPFIRSRKCLYYLQRWIDRNNGLKKHYSNIQEKCAEFEYQFVPKLKAVCRAYVALVQNECQIVNEAVLDLDGTFSRVAQGMDWQYFIATEPSLSATVLENEPNKMIFENSDHELTIPALVGELEIFNRLLRRWEPGTFCITRSGFLMRFENSLTEMAKHNVEPRWTINLATSVLGPLQKGRNEGTFALTAERYVNEGSRHRIVKIPLTLAKHTMSKLTTVKFSVSLDEAEDWYNMICEFSRRKPGIDVENRPRKGAKVGRRATGQVILPSSQAHLSALDEVDDGESEDSMCRESSRQPVHQHEDERWDQTFYDAAEDEAQETTIADLQPKQITDNPW